MLSMTDCLPCRCTDAELTHCLRPRHDGLRVATCARHCKPCVPSTGVCDITVGLPSQVELGENKIMWADVQEQQEKLKDDKEKLKDGQEKLKKVKREFDAAQAPRKYVN